MTRDPKPSLPRNRRFLVSIWHRDQADAPPGQGAAAEPRDDLHGLVWEADPRDPGRITQPASFGALAALPGIFTEFLYPVEPDGCDGEPDTKGGQ